MKKYIGLFFLLIVLLGTACKSKKGVTKNNKAKGTNKELKVLSEKLNLELDKSDNIHLYKFVAKWLGTPHKLGSCTTSSIDCSCFVQLLFEVVYEYKLPRTAAEMHKATKRKDSDNLKEGDLVFFKINANKVSHVGVYLKNGWFAHVSTSRGVMINNLNEAYYKKHYTDAGRVN